MWCHGSTAVAMSTVMLDDPGSNPGVNHGSMYLSRRCLVLSNYAMYRQLGKKPVDVSVYFISIIHYLVKVGALLRYWTFKKSRISNIKFSLRNFTQMRN
jgi:hypothetical protein